MPLMKMFRLRMDDITVCDVNGKLLLTNAQNYYPTLSTKVFSISSPIIVAHSHQCCVQPHQALCALIKH